MTEQLNKLNHITKTQGQAGFLFHKSFITLYFIFKHMSCVELNFWIKGEVCVKAYLFIHLFTYVSEKAMASHSNTLAWRIPWTEEPGRLQSMGSQRVGHD